MTKFTLLYKKSGLKSVWKLLKNKETISMNRLISGFAVINAGRNIYMCEGVMTL